MLYDNIKGVNMKNNRMLFRGILVLVLIGFFIMIVVKIKDSRNYSTFIFKAKETIFEQQYQNASDIIAHRMRKY